MARLSLNSRTEGHIRKEVEQTIAVCVKKASRILCLLWTRPFFHQGRYYLLLIYLPTDSLIQSHSLIQLSLKHTERLTTELLLWRNGSFERLWFRARLFNPFSQHSHVCCAATHTHTQLVAHTYIYWQSAWLINYWALNLVSKWRSIFLVRFYFCEDMLLKQEIDT